MTGEANCYYKARGFEYLDEEVDVMFHTAAKRMMRFSVGDLINADSCKNSNEYSKKWDMDEYMRQKGTETKLYKVIRELHESAEGGNDVDRQVLVDIVKGINWFNLPGYGEIGRTRKMIRML